MGRRSVITFATLGPSGTNHELVTKRYIDFHRIGGARIVFVDDFAVAADDLLNGRIDYIIQCAVHPDTPKTMGAHYKSMFVVDTFISPSKELAVLTRKSVETPTSIGLLRPATESYADLSRWTHRFHENSIPFVFEKMLAGEYDSGLVYLEYASQHPDLFRIDEVIGSPDDAWIVYGRERTYRDRILAWPDSPVVEQFRRLEKRDAA